MRPGEPVLSSDFHGGDADLGGRVLRGVVWKAASQTLLQSSRFVVAIILARLLAPEDYGLAAMVLVFSGLVALITDSALGTALIQRRALSERDRSTVFWTGVVIGTLFTALGLAAAGPIADFYGEPEVRPLFAALSLTFLVGSLGTTQAALFARDMNFRALELRQMGSALTGAVVGISIAAAGGGAWAIVLQQLVVVLASTVLLWRLSSWRPSLTYSPASLRSFARFGGNVFGQNTLYYLGRNVDQLLIGRVLGTASLGIYTLAHNVILAPFHRIAGPVQQVLFPAFARMQDDPERLASAWIKVSRLVGAISIPALVGLIVVAPDFVAVVLGDRWLEATTVIQILAWVGLLQSLQAVNGEVLLALDRSGTLFRFTILWFLGNVAALVVGLRWGIVGVAAGLAVVATIIEPINAYVTARALGIRLSRFGRAFAGIAAAAGTMGVVVLVGRVILVESGVPAPARLILIVLLGVAVFVPTCVWLAPQVVSELRGIVERRRRRSTAPAPVFVAPAPDPGGAR
jgi:O-antigen/teichoic acid export membrane protein